MYLQKRLDENPEKVVSAKDLLGDRYDEVIQVLKKHKNRAPKEVCEVLNSLRFTFVMNAKKEGGYDKARQNNQKLFKKEFHLILRNLEVSYAYEKKKQQNMGEKAYFESLKNEEMISFAELYCLTNQTSVRPSTFAQKMKTRSDIVQYNNRYFLPNPFHPENFQKETEDNLPFCSATVLSFSDLSSSLRRSSCDPKPNANTRQRNKLFLDGSKGEVKTLLKKIETPNEDSQKKVKYLLKKTKVLRKKLQKEIDILEVQIKKLSF